ncbi:MAG: ammonium transporter [Dehalococcoidia bacterium]|nr:ammonium transporter [Dehalococcoidia bacterium]
MELDSGNTAWMLAASAMVLFMTPGLAFFYGGLTRNKNVLGTIMQSFICTGIVAVIWVTIGYSLAFGPDQGLGLIGNFDFIGFKDVGALPGGPNVSFAEDGTLLTGAVYGLGIPHLMFAMFQMMFAIITPALITGAFAERAKFGPFMLFIALWSLLVYVPVAHWVFAYDGWLSAFASDGTAKGLNSLDFAGGLAIHINAGVAAIAAVLVFGKRKGYGVSAMEPHDVTMVVLGGAILWFGWFGFNAGSAGGATGQAVYAFANTNIAAATAGLAWTLISWWMSGKPSLVGAISGAVAGLVAVTPAAGYVEPMSAMIIGAGAGVICYLAVRARAALSFDDSLDVVGVHGVGGIWGAVATGLFATAEVSGLPYAEGLINGEAARLWDSIVGIFVIGAFSFIMTFIILKVLDMTLGIRVTEDDEELGLDVTQHGERAYTFDEGGVPLSAGQILPAPPAAYTSTAHPAPSGGK